MNTMKLGTIVEQRNIVLVPFPFTNLKASKRRPALIISNRKYNSKHEDVICCAITKNPNHPTVIEVQNKDLSEGRLRYESRIKPSKIFTLSQNLIIKKLAVLNLEKTKEVARELEASVSVDF